MTYFHSMYTCFSRVVCFFVTVSGHNDRQSCCYRCLCSAATDRQSPYLQKLGNSHVVPMNGSNRPRRRPASAASAGRPASAGVGGAGGGDKPKIDARFIADTDLWDPATPHDRHRQKRPTSAPVYKRSSW